jgi:cytochrome c
MVARTIALLAFCVFAATTASGAPAAPDAVARGHVLVQQNCGMCHATGAAGDSPNALAPHFRDLGDRYPVEDLGEALAEGIIVGHPQMPEFRFSADEIRDIIAYLQSIQVKRRAETPGSRTGS